MHPFLEISKSVISNWNFEWIDYIMNIITLVPVSAAQKPQLLLKLESI